MEDVTSFGPHSTGIPVSPHTDNVLDSDLAKKSDEQMKVLFKCKEVMSYVVLNTVKEFYNMKPAEVERYFLPYKPIPADDSNEGLVRIKGHRFLTDNVDSTSIDNKNVQFDLLFRMKNPQSPAGTIFLQLHIDFEMQQNGSPGYSVLSRGVYYCARMIQDQLAVGDNYNALEKVYSIWLVTENIPKGKNNTVEVYSIKEESGASPKEVDLLCVVMVYLDLATEDDTEGPPVITFLDTVFHKKNRKHELSYYFDFSTQKTIVEEVERMGSIGETIYKNGAREGKLEGKLEGKREGRLEGEREGKLEGEIKILQQIGYSRENAESQVRSGNNLTEQELQEYFTRYWE